MSLWAVMAKGGLASAESPVVTDVAAAKKQHASHSYHFQWQLRFAAAIHLYSTTWRDHLTLLQLRNDLLSTFCL